jgi:hypothetical protein
MWDAGRKKVEAFLWNVGLFGAAKILLEREPK